MAKIRSVKPMDYWVNQYKYGRNTNTGMRFSKFPCLKLVPNATSDFWFKKVINRSLVVLGPSFWLLVTGTNVEKHFLDPIYWILNTAHSRMHKKSIPPIKFTQSFENINGKFYKLLRSYRSIRLDSVGQILVLFVTIV